MGALDGFYSTWYKARETFGAGTPVDGSQHDGSSQLLKMKGMVESASQHDGWQGKGAEAYAAANKQHADVYQKLADLDKKMAAEVTNAANVVTNGRNQLDTTKSWVDSAVNALPQSLNSQAREKSLIPIAKEGITQVNTTVSNANGAMLQIGIRVNELKNGFDELQNQKLGPGDKKDGDGQPGGDDVHKRAEQDVQDALAGSNEEAAKRVDDILTSIEPGTTLTPEQSAYLSQMQAQQKGMSIAELKAAEDRLGDHRDILSNSWQLMSNDDVKFSHAETTPEALDDPTRSLEGSFDKLPNSIQESLRDAGIWAHQDNTTYLDHATDNYLLAEMVKHGDEKFQKGTELDRAMIRAADTVMDRYDYDKLSPTGREAVAQVAQELLGAAGRDHQSVHDHLVGSYRDGGLGSSQADRDDFLKDINRIDWDDNGTAAASLFSWTNEPPNGPEAFIAGETAHAYAQYIGSHDAELMSINGQTLGQLNPEIVKAYAHGLSPYMADIAGLSHENLKDTFGAIDVQSPDERPTAKGIFSVISTEASAYTEFHGTANAHILALSSSWAEDFKNGHPVSPSDHRLADSAILKGLDTVGTNEAARALGLNEQQVYDRQKAAYTKGVEFLSATANIVPWAGPYAGYNIENFADSFESSVIGEKPNPSVPTIPNMGTHEAARFALNALIASDVDIPVANNANDFGIPKEWQGSTSDNKSDDQIMPLEKLRNIGVSQAEMNERLNDVLDGVMTPGKSPTSTIMSNYNNIVKNP
ncbi:TPR repeat region-containing protein [Mycolicibacterium septicum]|uniref:TPR repeat region-containing protein n=1 Tax=Mycolicibacterium septicum TaxID=98668 RepID=UPI001AFC370B|nr:EspA/EspE family type VII secretion system effector [Mycolicibacterium septicum]QRY52215.1 hypothetical protein JVX95_02100 [Mycolicibacterium septicum]